jgi:hypothetical protein
MGAEAFAEVFKSSAVTIANTEESALFISCPYPNNHATEQRCPDLLHVMSLT